MHGRIQDALAQVSRLLTNAHHHDAAKDAGCPQSWKDMKKVDFNLKAPMIALEEIVPTADLAPLADY
eukprot:2756456-Pyramimonas_sp.AAC.1